LDVDGVRRHAERIPGGIAAHQIGARRRPYARDERLQRSSRILRRAVAPDVLDQRLGRVVRRAADGQRGDEAPGVRARQRNGHAFGVGDGDRAEHRHPQSAVQSHNASLGQAVCSVVVATASVFARRCGASRRDLRPTRGTLEELPAGRAKGVTGELHPRV
jgi:hypothetical protein